MKRKSYTVIYRTGGTDNFKWNKALPVDSLGEAVKQKDRLETSGYPALIHDTAAINSVGLPETYDASLYHWQPKR